MDWFLYYNRNQSIDLQNRSMDWFLYDNRNQSIDLQNRSMDWFLYDNGLRHERVNQKNK